MENKIVTKSGAELTQDDIRDIEKKSRKETLRNVFAAIGIIAVVKIGKAWLDSQTIKISPSADV